MARREPKPPYRPEDGDFPAPEPHLRSLNADPGARESRRTPRKGEYEPPRRPRPRPTALTRVRHAVDYAFYILYGLLVIRLVLSLMAAREAAPFTRLIHTLTDPFYAPFQGIVERPSVDGGAVDLPVVVAILAYALLHLAVRGLLRVVEGRPSTR